MRARPSTNTEPAREIDTFAATAVSATDIFYATSTYNGGARIRVCPIGSVCTAPN